MVSVSSSVFLDQGNFFWNQGILYQTIGRNPVKITHFDNSFISENIFCYLILLGKKFRWVKIFVT